MLHSAEKQLDSASVSAARTPTQRRHNTCSRPRSCRVLWEAFKGRHDRNRSAFRVVTRRETYSSWQQLADRKCSSELRFLQGNWGRMRLFSRQDRCTRLQRVTVCADDHRCKRLCSTVPGRWSSRKIKTGPTRCRAATSLASDFDEPKSNSHDAIRNRAKPKSPHDRIP